ncbi:ABC-type transport system involved in multi-copper enzyme maturation permease subunit [Streptomyces nodosus]|nr:ABC-type transport system involved in multi-copper enzyme maturation permease subunit [Streptomyces nodosus]
MTVRGVLRSEWTKLWSLRSTWIMLGLALLLLVGFGVFAAVRYRSQVDAGQSASGPFSGAFSDASAVSLSVFGINLGQLIMGTVGVLVMAAEYSTGMISSTLAAVPRRLPVLWSKAAIYATVSFAVGSAGALAAFLIGRPLLSGTPAALSPSDAGVLRSLLGSGLYLALVGVIGISLGALLRSVAGGITVLVVLLLTVRGLTTLLPASWDQHISPYLPSNAGASMYTLALTHDALSPGGGLAVLLGWTALALVGAAIRLKRSDA